MTFDQETALDDLWVRTATTLGYEVGSALETAPSHRAILLFHGICEVLVAGGKPITVERTRDPEAVGVATLRLVAALSDRWGLRLCFAPEDPALRATYRALGPDAMSSPFPDIARRRHATELAIRAWYMSSQEPFRTCLDATLSATSRWALSGNSGSGGVWSDAVPPHPLRLGGGPAVRDCTECAWNRRGRCLQADGPWGGVSRIPKGCPACARFEQRLEEADCADCGACCREGFTLAPVRRGEAMLAAHPEWILRSGRSAFLPRPGGRCVALAGDGSRARPWRCGDYEARPKACSGLDVGGSGCLDARRRVGLSAGG